MPPPAPEPRRPPPRNLAVVVKGYPRLSETFVAQELLALQERGFAFDIWSLRRPYDDRAHPIHARIAARVFYLPEYLHTAPARVWRGVAAARRLPGFGAARRLWLKDLRRDPTRNRVRRFGQACVLAAETPSQTGFLYAHFLHTPASVARYAAAMRGLRWGFSAHARDIWTTPDWERREKIADCAFGATCTAAGARVLRRWGADKIDLAYHGLDLSRLPPPPERLPSAGRPFRLVSVGRLVEKKGYDDLLAALALLPPALDWTFTHIGGGESARALAATAEARGLSPRIRWMGKRDRTEVIDALRAADLFVLPSKIAADGDRDGLPNVLMEAASQKLPILSTRLPGTAEFVRDGRDGVLVPPGDADALAAAMARLAADPAGRARMADGAWRRLNDEFGIETGIETIARRLETALAAAQTPPDLGGGP